VSGFLIHRVVGSRTVLSTVEQDTLRVGRGAGVDLRFDDTAVALEHALLRRLPDSGGRAGAYEVVDLGSITGTYRNGEQVASARLADGDEIGIGGWVLKVRWSDPEDPLFLHVRTAEAEPRPDAPPVAAPRVDYAAAYRLRRGLFNKATVSLLAVGVSVVALATLPLARKWDAFRPGALAPVHAGRIQPAACGACHTPFLGVADRRCQVCHGPGELDEAPVHAGGARVVQAGAAAACTTCHREHLGTDALVDAADARCLVCHRRLALEPGPQPPGAGASGEPAFAATVTRFGGDHPEFRVDLPVPQDGAATDRDGTPSETPRSVSFRRVPVTSPEARQGDPTALHMNHAKHLKPGLVTPLGRRDLTCETCHKLDAEGPSGLAPARFDTVCEECHGLTFDDRYPDEHAPHEGGQKLRDAIEGIYRDKEMTRPRTLGQRRRDSLINPKSRDEDLQRSAEAIAAEDRLYKQCIRCHTIDLDVDPPVVDTALAPERWLPHARFDHGAHRIEGLECEDCHAAARTSERASDLLLPGIASCTPCHGGISGSDEVEASRSFPVVPASNRCVSCHSYHSGALVPAGYLARTDEPRPPPPAVPSAAAPSSGAPR